MSFLSLKKKSIIKHRNIPNSFSCKHSQQANKWEHNSTGPKCSQGAPALLPASPEPRVASTQTPVPYNQSLLVCVLVLHCAGLIRLNGVR